MLYKTQENMDFNNFERDFDAFKDTNPDLVYDYESINGCLDNSIKQIYNAFKKSGQSDVSVFLTKVLSYANDNMTTLKAALNVVKESNKSDIITQYFSLVQDVYKKNGIVDITKVNHSETDERKMIENNLKTVISIAKRYINFGLSLEDLISAGNYGLCVAVSKYRDGKWKLRNAILMDLAGLNYTKPKKSNNDSFYDWNLFNSANVQPDGSYDKTKLKFKDYTHDELKAIIEKHITYGDIKDNILAVIPQGTISGDDVVKFVCKNVPPAKFNSVACMWIKAYILQEIDKVSKTMGGNTSVLRLDAPIKENTQNTFESIVNIYDDEDSEFEHKDKHAEFTRLFNLLTEGISSRHLIIVKKFYGIDYPSEITSKDIAFQENVTTARVSQILKTSLEIMKANAKKYNLEDDFMQLFN